MSWGKKVDKTSLWKDFINPYDQATRMFTEYAWHDVCSYGFPRLLGPLFILGLHLPFIFVTRKGLFLAQEKEEKQLLKSWTEIQWDESAKASEFQYPTPTPRKSEWSAFLKENVLKNTQTYKLHRIM